MSRISVSGRSVHTALSACLRISSISTRNPILFPTSFAIPNRPFGWPGNGRIGCLTISQQELNCFSVSTYIGNNYSKSVNIFCHFISITIHPSKIFTSPHPPPQLTYFISYCLPLSFARAHFSRHISF